MREAIDSNTGAVGEAIDGFMAAVAAAAEEKEEAVSSLAAF
jgi:uncharacterized protein YdbL (DUF1318 family)